MSELDGGDVLGCAQGSRGVRWTGAGGGNGWVRWENGDENGWRCVCLGWCWKGGMQRGKVLGLPILGALHNTTKAGVEAEGM